MNKGTSRNNRLSKRLYSVREASEYLGRSVCAVREMIWAGKIPSVRFDRKVYIDIYDLDALIEQNKEQFTY